MGNKINTKARLQRHVRIYKDLKWATKQFENGKRSFQTYNFNIALLIVVFLFPIYPSLASFVHKNNQHDFYRGDIDTTSIIGAYVVDDDDDSSITENSPILEATDSFLSVNTILNDERDLTGTNEILAYEVKNGESFYLLSYKFGVSLNTIYWANGFSKNHTLRPGDIIKIPPVSGLIHTVKKWDSLAKLSKSYDVEEWKILKQNLMKKNEKLVAWTVLTIPGAIKKAPVYNKPSTLVAVSNNNRGSGYSFAKQAKSSYTSNKWSYKLKRRKPYSWVGWNCTWYVASYKNVNWRGNANQWLRNARAKGHATGSTPKLGSIVALNGRGYNPRYGHVAIVMEVKNDYLIVSDMNYRRLYEVTYRKIPVNDRAIQWYIYVD